jgi:predicted  nucleic acid-binding Zn-ribbon protein
MYSDIKGAGTGSELVIWIATPDGYISPNMDVSRYVEAEKMLMRFALEVGREQLRLEVEEEEKALKELERELDRLKKEKDKFEKIIRDAEKAIEEARADIERNLDAQANKENEIGRQIEAVETIKRKLKDF